MSKRHTASLLKTVFFIFVIIVAVIVIAWSVIAASVSTGGINIGMAAPCFVALLFIGWAVYRLKQKKPLISHRGWRIAVTICICLGFLLLAVLETLVLSAALAPTPDEDADFIVVLGCGIFPDGRLTASLANRLSAAYDYLTMHEDTLCIVSGGQGGNEPIPESEAMKRYLVARGIPESRIVEENQSTSTEENLVYSLAIMRDIHQSDMQVGIVSNDYHLFRALSRARQYGIDAFGIGAPTPWPVWLANQVRECLAVLEMFVFG